jgi:hypothetical protein
MRTPDSEEITRWETDGYLLFHDAIHGEELSRLQASFDHWFDACKADWLTAIDTGASAATFYDIPQPLEKDHEFIDLVDHPAFYGYLKSFTDDQVLFLGPQFRTVPPWPLTYTSWHPDVGPTNPLHIKVQIYINDVEPGGGEFAFVPGSHRSDAGPYDRVRDPAAMPGHLRFPAKAGTAIMFNSYGWHTAMDNHSGKPRKSIILIYEKRTPERVRPDAFAAISEQLKTPERRRLFSQES